MDRRPSALDSAPRFGYSFGMRRSDPSGRRGGRAGAAVARESGRGATGGGTLGALLPWLGAGAALRIWTVAALARDPHITDPVLDSRHYFDLALRLSEGQGWPHAPLFFGALYPALLSGLFRVAPAQPLTVQIAQAALGLASLCLLFVATRRSFGSLAGHLAAALFVLAGPILAIENVVLMESLLLFLSTVMLWTWTDPRFGSARHPLPAAGFGLAAGLMALGRASFLLLPIAAVVWIVIAWRSAGGRRPSHGGGRRWVAPALILLGALLPLLPQAMHQTRTTGHLQLLTLNGGLNFYIGNNPYARGIFSNPPQIDLNDDLTARRAASIQAGRELTLAESSRHWLRRGLDFIRTEPLQALRLFARKALLFFAPREIPQIYNYDALSATTLPLRLAFVRAAWLVPLLGLGLAAVLLWRRRASASRSRLTPYLALIGIVWLQVILFFAAGRYRIVAYPAMIGLAGAGLAFAVREIRARRWLLPGAAALAILVMHLLPPSYPAAAARAFDAYTVGLRQMQQGNLAEGLRWYRRATELSPDFGEAWHGLGTIHYQVHQYAAAIRAYQEALERMPRSAITYYALGVAYHRAGNDAQAVPALERAVELNPRQPDYRNHLGMALANLGRYEEAAAQWREVLRLDPHHRGAQENLHRLSDRTQ
ncbi:MAG: tetratricopeptide repeat protein [Candidatus Eisenbacteria bacterium]|nr:tetratricopeptide repeat protein [Candidatus Eisenbacteria bacterium]